MKTRQCYNISIFCFVWLKKAKRECINNSNDLEVESISKNFEASSAWSIDLLCFYLTLTFIFALILLHVR